MTDFLLALGAGVVSAVAVVTMGSILEAICEYFRW